MLLRHISFTSVKVFPFPQHSEINKETFCHNKFVAKLC